MGKNFYYMKLTRRLENDILYKGKIYLEILLTIGLGTVLFNVIICVLDGFTLKKNRKKLRYNYT